MELDINCAIVFTFCLLEEAVHNDTIFQLILICSCIFHINKALANMLLLQMPRFHKLACLEVTIHDFLVRQMLFYFLRASPGLQVLTLQMVSCPLTFLFNLLLVCNQYYMIQVN